jgi:hypothetical protein
MTHEEYKAKTSKFTEEDFKNPTPEMEKDILYKLAYADWAMANGLCIKFENREELDEYLCKKLSIKKHAKVK